MRFGALQIRRRNGIVADSKVKILAAESDLYVAEIGGNVTVKMGARYDMGGLLPKEADGWKVATWGKDFCVSGVSGVAVCLDVYSCLFFVQLWFQVRNLGTHVLYSFGEDGCALRHGRAGAQGSRRLEGGNVGQGLLREWGFWGVLLYCDICP
jgi:hypothetical protein